MFDAPHVFRLDQLGRAKYEIAPDCMWVMTGEGDAYEFRRTDNGVSEESIGVQRTYGGMYVHLALTSADGIVFRRSGDTAQVRREHFDLSAKPKKMEELISEIQASDRMYLDLLGDWYKHVITYGEHCEEVAQVIEKLQDDLQIISEQYDALKEWRRQ